MVTLDPNEAVKALAKYFLAIKKGWNKNPVPYYLDCSFRLGFLSSPWFSCFNLICNNLLEIDKDLESILQEISNNPKNLDSNFKTFIEAKVITPDSMERAARVMEGAIDCFRNYLLGISDTGWHFEKAYENYVTRIPIEPDKKALLLPRHGLFASNKDEFNRWLASAAKIFGKPNWVEKYRIKGSIEEAKLETENKLGLIGPEIEFQKFDGLSWSDIAGVDEAKRILIEKLILPQINPHLAKYLGRKPSTGAVLVGEPGTGKTLLAKILSAEVDAYFVELKDVRSMWYGESERNVRAIFSALRKQIMEKGKSVILYIDEIDRILGGEHDVDAKIRSEFKRQLDSMEQNVFEKDGKVYRLFVIGSTNHPEIVTYDEALFRPGRLLKVVVPKPNQEAREKIWQIHLRNYRTGKINYKDLASRTNGMTGADIAGIISDVLPEIVYSRLLNGQPLNEKTVQELKKLDPFKDPSCVVTHEDLLEAIRRYESAKSPSKAPPENYIR